MNADDLRDLVTIALVTGAFIWAVFVGVRLYCTLIVMMAG